MTHTSQPPSTATLNTDEGRTPLAHLARRDLVQCVPETSVGEAARRMRSADCGSVLVARDGETLGIWTEADALRLELGDPGVRRSPLERVMSAPVASLPEYATADDAQARMTEGGMRHLLVTDADGHAVGVVSQTDLVTNRGLEAYLRLREVHTALPGDFLRLPAGQPLSRAARRMAEAGQPAAVVDYDLGEPGIVTERDVVRVLAEEDGDPPLEAAASQPLVSVDAEESLLVARERMREHGIRRVGVTDSAGGLLGLVGFADLLATGETGLIQRLEQALEETRAELRTARREKQRQEAEAAEYYEEMFRKNTAPKLLIDPETGYIADANPAALDFYGYSLEEIRNHRIQDINMLSPEEVQAEWEKARHEERRYFEFRHRLANGEIRDVKVYSGPIEMGGRQYLHSIIHDVTDVRRYLTHLERYKAIFETLPVGVFRNKPGPEGEFEEVNPAMARIFGAESVEELLRHTTAELYAEPEQRRAFSNELLEKGEIHRRELDLRTLDGRPVRGAITARLRHATGGEPYFDGVIEDVTERYQAERTRDQLLEIMEASPDYISMAEADGHILYINAGGLALFGQPTHCNGVHAPLPEGMEQAGAFQRPDWSRRKVQEEGIPRAKQEGYWEGETALFDADGNEVPVSQIIVAHYDGEGRVARVSTIARDISAQRTAEAFRRQLLDSLSEGVFGLDNDGRFTFLNPAAARMLGLDGEEQVLGENAHALTHHTYSDGTPFPESECPLLRIRETSEPLGEWEDWFWRYDGTGFPVAVFAAPLHDVDGEPQGVVVSFMDISKRKAAEAARDRVLAILDATPDFVSMAHADGRITYVNRGGLAMLGEDPDRTGLKRPLPEWLQGERAGELAHPPWARRVIEEKGMPTAAREGVWQGESAMVDAEGREIPASQVILAHSDERGEVAYFSTILRDISAQRELEAELRRETAFSQAIVRNLPGIFYLIDAEGRFVRWNHRLAEVTGYEGENELATISPLALYREDEQELIRERIQEVFDKGWATAEAHLRHRDGTLSPYYLTGFRVELEGEPYLLGVGLDISDRKAAEAELERSNAELEAFAYAVSHDLQEPLRIINSYLGLLQRRYGDSLDERAERYITATTDASERMRRMIQDLLEYSRIKRMGEEFRPVDLDEVASEAHANLEAAINDSGAEITMDPLPTVTGDHGQLVRLFQNLLSNAIKYGPADDVPRIAVTCRQPDGHWEIAVADNGLGIDPKQADRVFQVFQRLHTRDEHEGTGAGLALAQRIVERHGGRIWVESEGEGTGSTFRFTLPAAGDGQ